MLAFSQTVDLFICPICHNDFQLAGRSLICPKRHTFDLAKQGYANLLLNVKKDTHYNKESFIRRSHILEAGYYRHLLEAINNYLQLDEGGTILDVACGEGYYARALAQTPNRQILAFDLSKESILLAAKKDFQSRVIWFVGDLAKLPLADQSVDIILDIFSPAHYQEFQRVLKPTGKIIKVVTASDHLKELRQLAASQISSKDYSNQSVIAHFAQAFPHYAISHHSHTYPINQKDLSDFTQMTPLFFNVDTKQLKMESIREITIAADILIAGKL
ncbi:ribosomal RNA large subunit methyltransferase A [Streptococcus porcinus]|uniref:methyltransferase domain-containing protein n=1 Tax=Streptococcus porcinus TaxID=1340 RepID=UPI0010CAB41B|nr:methyltransferase domain-containing protein [Streptococcus porcinus]VTS16351.1 ribosomal RNA large subunit methyltransferase A [Streptococcus porcinus]